jgi:hypothetical protein
MKSAFKALFGNLSPWGKFWTVLGLATLAAAATMSFEFGSGVSRAHALFLACLSFVTAFAPEAAFGQWEKNRKGIGVAIALLCTPLFAIEFFSHAGYTAGLRGSNIEGAQVQNARYDGAQEAAKEDKANLEMWKRQLATLMELDAWTATVKADGLREELATLKGRIEEEKKGTRGRKAGCGKECERLQDEMKLVAERLGKVEQREDLSKRIEATQRILDKKRDVASATEHKSSPVEHQQRFLSKAVAIFGTGSLKPTEYIDAGTEQSVNLAMALAGTGLPALALFIAGLYRRAEDEERSKAASPTFASTNHTHTRETVKENPQALIALANLRGRLEARGFGVAA